MPDLLFEVGTEELPPGQIADILNQIKVNIVNELNKNNISVDTKNIKDFYTPRRITILISNLPDVQEIKTEEIKGPEKLKAFNREGKPTQAAIGFAKKYKLEPKDLTVKKINDTEYVFLVVKTGGNKVKTLLSTILPFALKETTGKKFMSWGNHSEKFVRPIRWLLTIFKNEMIDFSYSGIKSSNHTYGHRFHAKEKIVINSPEDYEKTLKENFVIVNPNKRKELIREELTKQAKKVNGAPIIKEELLEEVTNIVEYPGSLLGSFDKEFLSLPECVIETVLNSHQRYFAISNQTLLPYFIVITNSPLTDLETIKKGNEKVVTARLKDAQFFFNEDLKTSFNYEIRKNKLAKVTFQKGLGTLENKVERLIKLTKSIFDSLNNEIKSKINLDDLVNTAKLCKLDLTTHLVFEFTELQGEIGSIYARLNNYSENISSGIKEHYYPRFLQDKLPESFYGFITGIADKLDNIVCLFALDKIPSGSSDPFALRRQAQAIIDSLLNKNVTIDLTHVINYLIQILLEKDIKEKITGEKLNQINDFLIQRLVSNLQNAGHESDIINSVIAVRNPLQNLINTKTKIETLKDIFISNQKEKYIPFLVAAKRLVRIVEKNTNGNIHLRDLQNEHEKRLFLKFEELTSKLKSNQYKKTIDFLNDLSNLTDSINTFFDKVLVNDPDPKIKQVRQSLLKKGKDLFENVCDFNQIVERQ